MFYHKNQWHYPQDMPHEKGNKLPAFNCCFFAAGSSDCALSSELCLKTMGAREMVPGVESAEGSRRFA